MSTPHDALFKAVFTQPEHARGALRSMVPAALAEALDWSTLAHCPGSFSDPALSWQHTDLLFSVAWRRGGEALIYLLFEHQSTSDDRMAFRLLRYMVRIWDHWLVDHRRAKLLPIIVPLVLYHGEQAWSPPRTFGALFVERVGGPETKDVIMTAGERLIQQGEERGLKKGLEQGIQQGREQGIQQGREQGERNLLLRQLRRRFGSHVDARVEQRVAAASDEQIDVWAERVLTAGTLAELFA